MKNTNILQTMNVTKELLDETNRFRELSIDLWKRKVSLEVDVHDVVRCSFISIKTGQICILSAVFQCTLKMMLILSIRAV